MGGIGDKHKLFLTMTAEDLQQARYFNRIKLDRFSFPPKLDQLTTMTTSPEEDQLKSGEKDTKTSFKRFGDLQLVLDVLRNLQEMRDDNEDGIRLLYKTDERNVDHTKGIELLLEGIRKLLELQSRLFEVCERWTVAASETEEKQNIRKRSSSCDNFKPKRRKSEDQPEQDSVPLTNEHLTAICDMLSERNFQEDTSLPDQDDTSVPDIKLEEQLPENQQEDGYLSPLTSVKIECENDVDLDDNQDSSELTDDFDDEPTDVLEDMLQIDSDEKENKTDVKDENQLVTSSFCEKVFKTSEEVQVHKKAQDDGGIEDSKEDFRCDVCKKYFSARQTLKVHMRVHTGEKPFKCDQCPKSYSQLATLIRHKRTHTGEKPFKCDQCGRDFRESSALKTHMRIHTGEKPFECDECDQKFAHQAGLRSHKLVHHNSGKDSERRPFKCDQCYKDFSLKNQLRTHMRTHTGEKPYQCQFCLKSFTDYSTMKYHVKVHKGEKNFKCDVCGKTWIRQSNLRNHMRTHTGEKPFKCGVCDKDFSRKDRLRTHEWRHCLNADNNPVLVEPATVLDSTDPARIVR